MPFRTESHTTASMDGDHLGQLQEIPNRIPEKELTRRKKQCEEIMFVIVGHRVPIEWHDGKNPQFSGNFWDFNTQKHGEWGKVFLDESILQGLDGYGQAIALHEFCHVATENMRFHSEDDLKQYGYLMGYNFWGDNAVESYGMKAHRQGRKWIEVKSAQDMGENGGLNPKAKSILEKGVGYIPDHALLGGMARQYFFKRDVNGDLNVDGKIGPNSVLNPEKFSEFVDNNEDFPPNVREVFKKLHQNGAVEEFYALTPPPLSREKTVDRFAAERAFFYKEKVWPEYQKLVQQSYDDNALLDFLKQLSEGQSFSGQDGQVVMIDMNTLSPEAQKEIKKMMQEWEEQQSQQEQQAGDQSAGQQDGQPGGQQEGQAGQAGQTGQEGQAGYQQSQPGEQTGQSGSSAVPHSPINQLSPKVREEVEKAFGQVSEQETQEIRQRTKDKMGAAEDALNKEMQASTNKEGGAAQSQLGPQTQGDQDSNDEQQHSDNSKQGESGDAGDGDGAGDGTGQGFSDGGSSKNKQPVKDPFAEVDFSAIKKEIEEQAEELRRDTPQEERVQSENTASAVDTLRAKVKQELSKDFDSFWNHFPEIEDVADILGEKLWAALRPDKQPLRVVDRRGRFKTKYYLKRFMTRGDMRHREREIDPQETSVGITYLVDLSGSTHANASGRGEGIGYLDRDVTKQVGKTILGEEIKMVSAAAKVQQEMGIRTEIQGFPSSQGAMNVFVSAETFEEVQGYDFLTEEIKAGIWLMVHESGGGTPLDSALEKSYKRLKFLEDNPQLKKDVTFLVILTDGEPDGGPHQIVQTVEAIYRDAQQEGMSLVVLVLGIGQGTENVSALSAPLPEAVQLKIADRLSELRGKEVSPTQVTTSFRNVREAAEVYPLLLEEMLKNPNAFREILEGKEQRASR